MGRIKGTPQKRRSTVFGTRIQFQKTSVMAANDVTSPSSSNDKSWLSSLTTVSLSNDPDPNPNHLPTNTTKQIMVKNTNTNTNTNTIMNTNTSHPCPEELDEGGQTANPVLGNQGKDRSYRIMTTLTNDSSKDDIEPMVKEDGVTSRMDETKQCRDTVLHTQMPSSQAQVTERNDNEPQTQQEQTEHQTEEWQHPNHSAPLSLPDQSLRDISAAVHGGSHITLSSTLERTSAVTVEIQTMMEKENDVDDPDASTENSLSLNDIGNRSDEDDNWMSKRGSEHFVLSLQSGEESNTDVQIIEEKDDVNYQLENDYDMESAQKSRRFAQSEDETVSVYSDNENEEEEKETVMIEAEGEDANASADKEGNLNDKMVALETHHTRADREQVYESKAETAKQQEGQNDAEKTRCESDVASVNNRSSEYQEVSKKEQQGEILRVEMENRNSESPSVASRRRSTRFKMSFDSSVQESCERTPTRRSTRPNQNSRSNQRIQRSEAGTRTRSKPSPEPPRIQTQAERDIYLDVGHRVYAPYPGKNPNKECK